MKIVLITGPSAGIDKTTALDLTNPRFNFTATFQR